MLPRSTGAVGGGTRDVAHVLRRVAGHRSAVARSYLARFFTPSRCGRGHSACCPGRLACCRAPVGRCQVVVGTFLHAVGVWEGALDVLPGSSGVLPGSPWLLPDRSRTFPVSSRLLPAPVLHRLFLPPTSGVHDVQSLRREPRLPRRQSRRDPDHACRLLRAHDARSAASRGDPGGPDRQRSGKRPEHPRQ